MGRPTIHAEAMTPCDRQRRHRAKRRREAREAASARADEPVGVPTGCVVVVDETPAPAPAASTPEPAAVRQVPTAIERTRRWFRMNELGREALLGLISRCAGDADPVVEAAETELRARWGRRERWGLRERG